jgi:hypothetical protein
VNKEFGQAFIDWLVSPDGQKASPNFKINGEQLFYPNADDSRLKRLSKRAFTSLPPRATAVICNVRPPSLASGLQKCRFGKFFRA